MRRFVPFSANTRMSGVDIGAAARCARARPIPCANTSKHWHLPFPPELAKLVDDVARRGSTPLVVADGGRVLGVVELKDIVKGGIKERFARTAPHGHQDGDDHRRQPPDRRGDRRRSGGG